MPTLSCAMEKFVVRYGTEKDELLKENDETTTSGIDPLSENVPFSAILTGLVGNTVYYYQVIAENTVGSTESEVASFDTGNSKRDLVRATTAASEPSQVQSGAHEPPLMRSACVTFTLINSCQCRAHTPFFFPF